MIKHRTIPQKKGGSTRGLELKRDDGEKKKFDNRKPERRNARLFPSVEKTRARLSIVFPFYFFFLFSFLFSAFLIIEFLLDRTGRLCLSFYPDFDKSFLSLQTRRAHGSLSTASTISYLRSAFSLSLPLELALLLLLLLLALRLLLYAISYESIPSFFSSFLDLSSVVKSKFYQQSLYVPSNV